MKKTIEQVEQEIAEVLSETETPVRPSAWLSAPHAEEVDVDFEIPIPIELPEPYPNASYIRLLYRGPSRFVWMRSNPGGNYWHWLCTTYLRQTDLYKRGWKRVDIEVGLGDPDRYCCSRFGLVGLYHVAHVAAAEATEWFETRPCVVAPRLYLQGLSIRRIAKLLDQPESRITNWTKPIRRDIRQGRVTRNRLRR